MVADIGATIAKPPKDLCGPGQRLLGACDNVGNSQGSATIGCLLWVLAFQVESRPTASTGIVSKLAEIAKLPNSQYDECHAALYVFGECQISLCRTG